MPTELVDFLVDGSGRSNPTFLPDEIPEELRDVTDAVVAWPRWRGLRNWP